MKIKDIILSSNYLDVINKIDSLIFEITYGENGYLALTSKGALEEYSKVVEKYKYEIEKITKYKDIKILEEVIKSKEEYFFNLLKEHYNKQAIIWAQDVYDDLITNAKISISLNKDDTRNFIECLNIGKKATTWICQIKNLSLKDEEKIFEKFLNDCKATMNSQDSDFIPKIKHVKTSPEIFMEFFNLASSKPDEFILANLLDKNDVISKEDLAILNKIREKLKTQKRTLQIDELKMINCAIDLISLKKNEEKYDFSNNQLKNQEISEEEKIKILKRRMQIFSENTKNKNNYYVNLLTT